MGGSCSFCQLDNFMADKSLGICMASSSVQHRIPTFWIWKSSRFWFKTKNIPQPYQSCSRRASNSSRQPEEWSFCPLHLLYLERRNSIWAIPTETEEEASIYPSFLRNKAYFQPQTPASFPFSSPSLRSQSINPFIPSKTEKTCTSYAYFFSGFLERSCVALSPDVYVFV